MANSRYFRIVRDVHALNVNAPGLDPHADTPVEILHTVLLGFVKYFWHDVVHNQLATNPPKKELLKTRLNSLDVSGLQVGQQLSGRTLVQYAGSLTGRDFRIIAQVAPYVLYDLVPVVCFDAWDILQIRHILSRQNFGNDTLISMPSSDFITYFYFTFL